MCPPPSLHSLTCRSGRSLSALSSYHRDVPIKATSLGLRHCSLSLLSLESSCSVRNPESRSVWSPTSPHWTWEFQLPRLGERRELSILLGLAPSSLSCLGQVFISLGLSFSSMKNKNSTILHPRAAKTAGLSWNHVLICVQGSFSVLQH